MIRYLLRGDFTHGHPHPRPSTIIGDKERMLLRFIVWFLVSSQFAAAWAGTEEMSMINVVPLPGKVDVRQGKFELNGHTVLITDRKSKPAAEWLAAQLNPATGHKLAVREGKSAVSNSIFLTVSPSATMGQEGYELTVTPDKVVVHGGGAAGAFYGCQTIRQLLPPQIESSVKVPDASWSIQCVKIEDTPRFGWRGCLIDEARHFLGKDVIKRQIDLLAAYKLNRLHWHLTDDQGWRIEIRKYPKLTGVGAWRGADRQGGFYTQKDIREIVQYAESRHVLIVPEIEMPGHAQAALASYPQLGCRGEGYTVGTTWGIYNDVYCPGNDEVFTFLENVLLEVMDLFPGQYIHIGGDEVPKDRWQKCPKCQARIKANGLKDEHELQSYFVKHFDKFIRTHGRKLIGWDEILDGGLAEGAVVQAWRGMDEGIKAANQDHDVIMSPTSDCYFDYGYDAISTMKIYFFEPLPKEVRKDKTSRILGLEGNLWGEGIPNSDRLDFQGFPRLCALAEVGWSPQELRDADNFAKRIKTQYERLDLLGVKYNRDAKLASWGKTIGQWAPVQITSGFKPAEWDITTLVVKPGICEATFKYTAGQYGIDIEWVALLEDGTEVARDTHKGFSGYNKDNITYRLDLKDVKPDAKYVIQASIKGNGGTDSAGDVLLLQ